MNEKNKQERILAGMTVKEAIFRCGELKLPYEQVDRLVAESHIRLIRSSYSPTCKRPEPTNTNGTSPALLKVI